MSNRDTTQLWEDYQNGLAYQATSGLSRNIPVFVNFYEGKQWPEPTKRTKNLPRPVVNIVKMICRAKKSAILSAPVKIIYRAEDEMADVEKFNNFASYIQREIGQELLDKKAIDDGVKKGTYVYHYYWDSEAKGKDGIKEGGLRCEIIDPLNIFFSNPTETDEQKQKWILIASREDVDSIKAKCDAGVDKDLIISDESDSKYDTVEQEGNKLCTVLTRYFRKNGEVFYEKATKSVIVNKPSPLCPDIESAGKELGLEDAPNNSLPDNHKENLNPTGTNAYLYPIVVGNYEIRENSIYGMGEVEGIIPNQKSINFNLAMSLFNAQEVAWGKYIVLPNALKGQAINNEPGQVLIDYSNTGNGIRKMTEQVMQSQPLQLVETLTQLTRTATGSTEVMTGEIIGSNMSGAAIAQLQSQAQQPVEELRDAFWLVKEKQGKVLAQFFKLYYSFKEFTYDATKPKTDEFGQLILNEAGLPEEEETQLADEFSSADYKNTEFSVVVETTSGTKATAAGDINALDVLLSKGLISLKTYLKAYPKDALSNRTEILKGIKEDEKSQLAALQQQIAQYEQQLLQSTDIIKRQKDTVDKVVSLIQENDRLKTLIATLREEASGKIKLANVVIKANEAKVAETTADARDFATHIANMEGNNEVRQMPNRSNSQKR